MTHYGSYLSSLSTFEALGKFNLSGQSMHIQYYGMFVKSMITKLLLLCASCCFCSLFYTTIISYNKEIVFAIIIYITAMCIMRWSSQLTFLHAVGLTHLFLERNLVNWKSIQFQTLDGLNLTAETKIQNSTIIHFSLMIWLTFN